MKSSTGAHFIALDHIRALAAFIVCVWHFTHASTGYPSPLEFTPSLALFPLSILDEGHTGVAVFMTLSGFLFAALLDGKAINFRAFLWNRAVRLLPLLVLVLVMAGVETVVMGGSLSAYLQSIIRGPLLPSLPNGGWSITTEFHFYLILPILLWMLRKSRLLPVLILVLAVALRGLLYHQTGEVQPLAYYTLLGRIDQFVLGMLAFQLRARIERRHALGLGTIAAFALFYWAFDTRGGYYGGMNAPAMQFLWIFLPTVEAIAYGIGIAWYSGSFTHSATGVSKWIARFGDYSYAVYLLHFFFVFRAAAFVHERIMDISNFYLAATWAAVFYGAMMPLGYLSHRFVEMPFLKLRKKYVIARAGEGR